MNGFSRQNKSCFYIIFAIVAFALIFSMLFKPAMRLFYPVKYISIIERHSREYELDKHLVMAIISTESKFDEYAVSRKEARGLMQLKPETALWCAEKFGIGSDGVDIFVPQFNIQIGCAYMRYLLDKFDSNLNTALAAYNAGEGNVAKWLNEQNNGIELLNIPFEETKKYVELVNKRNKIYRFLY